MQTLISVGIGAECGPTNGALPVLEFGPSGASKRGGGNQVTWDLIQRYRYSGTVR